MCKGRKISFKNEYCLEAGCRLGLGIFGQVADFAVKRNKPG